MTRIGTNIFVSKRQAYNYYADLGFFEDEVDKKILDAEIIISAKKPFPDAFIHEGRWLIPGEENNGKH